MKKRILIVCPVVPYPENGAEQSDRANGIRQFIRLGYDVKVIAKRRVYQTDSDIEKFSQSVGNTPIITVPYRPTFSEHSFGGKVNILLRRFSKFSYLDGAAFEYLDPKIQVIVENEISIWKPDIIWFEYTYLWPLFPIVLKQNIPIVTRSINYEPAHFLDEDGHNLINIVRALPKYISEKKIVKYSNLICAITPKEEKIYRNLGAKTVITLPLRGLHRVEAHITRREDVIQKGPMNLVFMGSTYNVSHNLNAARFVTEDIAPKLAEKFGPRFVIYITGAKMPKYLEAKLPRNVVYKGYVNDLDSFLKDMDCAIVPSLFGAGMQQKIFEPLMRGIPAIVSSRGLAGYPFRNGKDVLLANTPDEFVSCIDTLYSNPSLLISMGKSARIKSIGFFGKETIDLNLENALATLI